MSRRPVPTRLLHALALAAALALPGPAAAPAAAEPVRMSGGHGRPLTLVLRDVPLAEVYEMLSRNERVNILLGKEVGGTVSVNLFEVSVDQAIRAIAEAAGYVAERRRGAWMIVARENAGKEAATGNTEIRTFKVQYSPPGPVAEIVGKYLSRYGDVTVLEDRGMIVVEDLPDFVERVEGLLGELDREPRQILIRARILEITLDDSHSYGIDWKKLFAAGGGDGSFGIRGLGSKTAPGFFFDLVSPNIEVALDALAERGRVRTLSTPTLLAVEHEEAEVVIGDRLGFRVTTTINEVTSESVEFLESGVILKFTASVDDRGRIILDVHPEVSTGTISDGLPSQTTTEVTTRLISEDGQKVFIGGLIKDRRTRSRRGVPYLRDVPVLGWLFRTEEDVTVSTETVVVIATHLVSPPTHEASTHTIERVDAVERELDERRGELQQFFEEMDDVLGDPGPRYNPPAAPDPGAAEEPKP